MATRSDGHSYVVGPDLPDSEETGTGTGTGARSLTARPTPADPARWAAPKAFTLSVILVGASVLAGCAGQEQSGPPAARVSAWVSGAGGGAAIGTLQVETRNIDLALYRHDPAAAIKTVCALLTNDAQTAIGNLPTPDPQLTADLNRAYEDAAAAGDDCYAGSSGTPSLLQRSAAERARLMPLLAASLDRITHLTGHTPSTSTTRPAAGTGDPFGN